MILFILMLLLLATKSDAVDYYSDPHEYYYDDVSNYGESSDTEHDNYYNSYDNAPHYETENENSIDDPFYNTDEGYDENLGYDENTNGNEYFDDSYDTGASAPHYETESENYVDETFYHNDDNYDENKGYDENVKSYDYYTDSYDAADSAPHYETEHDNYVDESFYHTDNGDDETKAYDENHYSDDTFDSSDAEFVDLVFDMVNDDFVDDILGEPDEETNYERMADYEDDESIVSTTHGLVKGQTEVVQISSGQEVKVDVFWAIPFAKPPVDDLRFKPPVPSEPWDDLLEAHGPPNTCMQVSDPDPVVLPNPETPLSEDCLYLTIWRPRCGDERPATMVWIFGGGYMTGAATSSIYNGGVLAASQCIMIAAMNYRLGALGFMFLDISDIPGNMGLLDMILALEWVTANVEHFGGDPNRITIAGFSAGAASANLFLLSPLTRDLVDRALFQSGSALSIEAVQSRESALLAAHTLSKSVGCLSVVHSEIADCLRKLDAGILTSMHASLVATNSEYRMTGVVDYHFLMKMPQEYLASGDFKRCSILLGSASSEGTFFLHRFWPQVYTFHVEVPTTVTEEALDTKLSAFFGIFLNSGYIPEIISNVKRVYQIDELWYTGDAYRTLLNLVMGDVIFTCPTRRMAAFYAEASENVYLYSFRHPHDYTERPFWAGAMHGDDLDFVFGTASIDEKHFSSREAELSEAMMTFYGNFVKYGNPTPSHVHGVIWPTYWTPDPGGLLTITPSAEVTRDVTEDSRCQFWNNLPQEYFRS